MPEEKSRITAGPIESLDVTVEDLERIGYVAMRQVATSNTKLLVNTVAGKELVCCLPNCGMDRIMETVHAYLNRIDGYLTYAQSTNSGFLGFKPQQMTGDLYKRK